MKPCIDHGGVNRYASCKFGGRWIGKHVRVLIVKTGEQPDGRYALHTCGNHRCLEPEHLYWGTQSDNMKDAVRDGTHRCLDSRKLTEAEIADCLSIHVRYCRHNGSRALAQKYGVCQQTINRLVRNGGY